ncbi:3-hydroxyacyl-CoA dehydrogenase [Alicyclobacillaceae bacterium I2511]|nr:3-hydroxyacyl-CoA dehydrogenase [Alicyclobacillaceae bacterium I2511]
MNEGTDRASRTVAVVGAGTMGAGIAQVALQSGFSVRLYDTQSTALERARQGIGQRLDRWVEKSLFSIEEGASARQRLQTVTRLEELVGAQLVIEAVPERMELKRELFTALDVLCTPTTLLASNTSSFSVTALAAVLQHPERVLGLHFFNPAPIMQLVEVVVGQDTDASTLKQALNFAREFGKQPIVCKDTPGFVVNRVARNFYGEALRLVGEGTAGLQQVDTLVRQGLGFPLGPFELMDLIGIDVNFDVTQSVYRAFYEEPRFRPHPIQAQMVATGRLGKKTGRGFYQYNEFGERLHITETVPADSVGASSSEFTLTDSTPVDPADGHPTGNSAGLSNGLSAGDALLATAVVVGDTPLARVLCTQLAQVRGVAEAACGLVYPQGIPRADQAAKHVRMEALESFVREHRAQLVVASFAGEKDVVGAQLQAVERGVSEQTVLLTSLAGPSATEWACWLVHSGRLRGFWVSLPLRSQAGESQAWEWSVPLQCCGQDTPEEMKRVDGVTQALIRSLGGQPFAVRDGAGGVQMRILAMLCSEACEVYREGTASLADVDLGMCLGTHWPQGPFTWLQTVSVSTVYYTLAAVWQEQGEDRYRPSPLLRQMGLADVLDLSVLQGHNSVGCGQPARL